MSCLFAFSHLCCETNTLALLEVEVCGRLDTARGSRFRGGSTRSAAQTQGGSERPTTNKKDIQRMREGEEEEEEEEGGDRRLLSRHGELKVADGVHGHSPDRDRIHRRLHVVLGEGAERANQTRKRRLWPNRDGLRENEVLLRGSHGQQDAEKDGAEKGQRRLALGKFSKMMRVASQRK